MAILGGNRLDSYALLSGVGSFFGKLLLHIFAREPFGHSKTRFAQEKTHRLLLLHSGVQIA